MNNEIGKTTVDILINALVYKKNSSGIGVLLRELFGAYAAMTHRKCRVLIPQDAPDFPCGETAEVIRIPWNHGQNLRRVWFQTVQMGRDYGRNAIYLTTDCRIPFFLPKNCIVVSLVTDLAVYRMPEVYRASRVLWWRLQYWYLRRRADVLFSISQFTREEMVQLFRLPPEKIGVIPCACSSQMRRVTDVRRLDALRETYQLPEQFVLFVGNANPRKNLTRMIRAFDLAKEQGIAHQLVIAGEQGWKFDREQALQGIRHPEDIRFIGFVPDEDMPALYSAASLFLFLSLYEGFGIPMVEAQACGTPVLASNSSSLPEVGGDAALYVDPYSEEAIRDGILAVLRNRQLAETLARNGLENAKRFCWQASAEKFYTLLEDALAMR